jgi:hypothetical protein
MSNETPDERIGQDPGIPGFDTPVEPDDAPASAERDTAAPQRERADDPDDEGHMTAPSG